MSSFELRTLSTEAIAAAKILMSWDLVGHG